MGNKTCECCEDETHNFEVSKQLANSIKVQNYSQIKKPNLSAAVRCHLEEYKPFRNELSTDAVLRKFGEDVYEGKINSRGKPDGYGMMYHKNGTVFTGLFVNGIAQGLGHYVLQDGSYYHGTFAENKAKDEQGQFYSLNLTYKGGFKGNTFDGLGQIEGDRYIFQGLFKQGIKVKGKLIWSEEPVLDKSHWQQTAQKPSNLYTYEGNFDKDGLFTQKAKLQSPKGIYQGEFKRGKKQGNGEFEYFSGGRYEGEYRDGEKNGKGTIFKGNKISYSGEWKDGVPHGNGFIMNSFGDKIQLTWKDGLDERIIPDRDEDGHGDFDLNLE